MTFLCLYISRWWRQTWDTAPYFTVVNKSEARISTEHGIRLLIHAESPLKLDHGWLIVPERFYIIDYLSMLKIKCWFSSPSFRGRVTHISVSKITIIGSDNGLSPGRCQAIIWTNTGIMLIGPRQTNISEILIEKYTFSFKKMHLTMSSGKWWPVCLGFNVLITSAQRHYHREQT